VPAVDNPAMSPLIEALRDPRCYPHPVERVELIETHISWLLLTGRYAYKLKKPVSLGFLDFSTLDRRRHFCEEELRLNRRLAPELYLDVVPITGRADAPQIDGSGEPIEWAVRMRQFDQADLLDRRIAAGTLGAETVDALADRVAAFHASASSAPVDSPWADPAAALAPALDNFAAIERVLAPIHRDPRLAELRAWTLATHARLRPLLAARAKAGRVRECHGDLHLGNIALVDGRPTVFDCIEFAAGLRWIDVMSECAFLWMDCAARGHPGSGHRFINRWLEASGDYGGVATLAFFAVYRAMVRAKVDALRAGERDIPAATASRERQDFDARLALAHRFTAAPRPLLVITCGASGTGKTHASQVALEALGAIRIRSDVERKRLFGIAAHESSGSGHGTGIYTVDATRRTIDRLDALTRDCLAGGARVIVDATFLSAANRARFRAIAAEARVPFAIIACSAPAEVVADRIARRLRAASDASEADHAVHARQLARAEPFTGDEQRMLIPVDTSDPTAIAAMVDALRRIAGA